MTGKQTFQIEGGREGSVMRTGPARGTGVFPWMEVGVELLLLLGSALPTDLYISGDHR